MDTVRLGNSGLQVSRLCLGMMSFGSRSWRPWVLEEDEARPIVRRAVEAGVNFFDTADMYSVGRSEEVTGALVREMMPREEAVIATKVYFPHGDGPNRGGLSRKHIFDAVEGSLRRLGTDTIDLYQIHRFDAETPLEETLEALHDVVKAGYVRYIGASSMRAYRFAKLLHVAEGRGWTRMISMQPHYNLLYREEEREMLPLCREEGVGVLPWSPLARGYLTRRPSERKATPRGANENLADRLYHHPDDDAIIDAVCDVAEERGATPAQVALAWLLQRPEVTAPIVGVTKLAHLDDALGALGLGLDDAEVARLEAAYGPREPMALV
ncbi:MAG: aldo/keto reductase [Deinococcales bacterium]